MFLSQPVHKLVKKFVEIAPGSTRTQPDATGIALDFKSADATAYRRKRVVPAYLCGVFGASIRSLQRRSDAIGIV